LTCDFFLFFHYLDPSRGTVRSTTDVQEIELIIENVRGGGGGKPPANEGGGDEGGRGRGPSRRFSSRRYFTAIAIAMVSILMFFMALVSAYVVRKGSASDWATFHFPAIIWLNTATLVTSSVTLELARRRLAKSDLSGFRALWWISTVLGFGFLAGQIFVWRQLVYQGVFLASNPASSFFYIFTGAHALHILGGVGALLFVALRNFDLAKVTRSTAAEVSSYFWHFLDALWIFLAVLLYLGG
jgi:cytochrome c oxidase subunit 3